jgi:hypothetical protein
MKFSIILFVLFISCKSSFFAFDRPLPDYPDPMQQIVILKISKRTPEYSIYKASAIKEKIPFFFKTNLQLTVGEIVSYAYVVRGDSKYRYF